MKAGAANNAAAGKNGTADNRAAGAWILFDLGREAVGFPELSFTADGPCRVCVGWGEHIADGMCRCAIHNRRFTFEYAAHEGANRVFPVLRRLGCRYLQVFIEGRPRDVRLRFAEVLNPVEVKQTALTGLRRKIYDTAVHTLRCCMHEHYEDCPWREQALYTLDSRNQMLAGYAAFEGGNTEMARASLDLISRGVRPDGLFASFRGEDTDSPPDCDARVSVLTQAPVILREIDRDGEEMLAQGATTFFETRKGEKDFDGAESLCHGWSAMAAYYYRKLCEKE